MHLLAARVKNYKCFADTCEIAFGPGFNVLLGKNDAGKSAFIEALSLSKPASPHRSPTSAPREDSVIRPASEVELTYQLSADFLAAHFARQERIDLPVARPGGPLPIQELQALFGQAIAGDSAFAAQWRSSSASQEPQFVRGALEALQAFDHSGAVLQFRNSGYPGSTELSYLNQQMTNYTYANELASELRRRTYAFRAERLNVSSTASRGGEVLQADASNLGEVLNSLVSADRYRYEELMRHVRSIFPHITEINPRPRPSGEIEVTISTSAPSLSRADLDVSLRDSGTGIGQVLAMLYVVVKSRRSQIILIDEPQSFLHPGAVRKLMEILRSYDLHQYIIATHSPLPLDHGDADRTFVVRREHDGTRVQAISMNSQDDLRMSLAEVGVRIGDVFGADAILWVEGKTEEVCFPELIRALGARRLQGVQILGVVSTDELAAKHAPRVFEVYERLSSGASLLPPAIAFVFDREDRPESLRQRMESLSGGRLRWLPLRMYENYLLEPEAIANILNVLDVGRAERVVAEQVASWMESHSNRSKYFGEEKVVPYGEPDWWVKIRGSLILNDIFSELTNARHEYDKVRHGLMLTRYLIEHPSARIRELAAILSNLLPA